VSVAAVIGQWGALAWLVTAADGAPAAQRLWAGVTSLAVATLVRAAAAHVSRLHADRGARAVADELRRRVLGAVLPDQRGGAIPSAPPPAETAAHAVLDLPDLIAAHLGRAQPVRLAAGPCCALVVVAVAFVNWPVAVLLVLATPILAVNMRLAGLSAEAASRAQLNAVRSLSACLLDRFRGMRTLRTLGAAEREMAVVQSASDALNRATTAVLRRAFVASSVLDAVITFAIAICATYVGLDLLGFIRLAWLPQLGFGAGFLSLVLVPVYFSPLKELATGYHERDEALAAAASLAPLTGSEPANPAAGESTPRDPQGIGIPALLRLPAAPSVEIRDLVVRHARDGEGEVVALDHAEAVLRSGRLAVLTGPSGAGKSTLLKVIAGLRAPTTGQVLLRDPGTGKARPPHAGQASWIGQQTVLIAGSLADNIRLGAPLADQAQVERAAVRAGLGQVIGRLPRELDTEVGDNGWGISAGEARRVALARALLRDAPLWLLDEPTAHLDSGTEQEVLAAIIAAAAGRTVLIATHCTMSTAHADVEWRLDRGRLDAQVVRVAAP